MCSKMRCVYSIIAVVVAIVIGVAAIVVPAEQQMVVATVMKFVEILIPVLAVFALLKYLCCPGGNKE